PTDERNGRPGVQAKVKFGVTVERAFPAQGCRLFVARRDLGVENLPVAFARERRCRYNCFTAAEAMHPHLAAFRGRVLLADRQDLKPMEDWRWQWAKRNRDDEDRSGYKRQQNPCRFGPPPERPQSWQREPEEEQVGKPGKQNRQIGRN